MPDDFKAKMHDYILCRWGFGVAEVGYPLA